MNKMADFERTRVREPDAPQLNGYEILLRLRKEWDERQLTGQIVINTTINSSAVVAHLQGKLKTPELFDSFNRWTSLSIVKHEDFRRFGVMRRYVNLWSGALFLIMVGALGMIIGLMRTRRRWLRIDD